MALNVVDLPCKVLNILKNEDSSWGVFIRDLRAFLGKPSTNRAMKDSSVEVLVALFYYVPRSIMIIAWATRTMVLVYQPSHNRAPEWDVSATAETKYDPFGERP